MVQCIYCKGFYHRRKFHVHVKKCAEDLNRKEGEEKLLALGKHAHPILPPVDGLDEEFIEKIMTNMKNDAIGKVIQKDPLILLFGVVFLKSRWHSSGKSYVRREMRTLASLLVHMKKINPAITDFASCLTV